MQYGECEVKTVKNAKINGRSCTCIQVVHPTPRKNFIFHLARIFVDDELNIPVRYEAHDWPEEEGGKPQLIEEYTFLNIKVNNGFTDLDFDIKNPNYDYN
jgi:outer membrane lipoprotein-sorting protein